MAHADAIGAAMAEGVPEDAIPPVLNDRDADSWRPMLGLAARAGLDWPARAERAAVALCREGTDNDRGNEWVLRQIVEFVDEQRQAAVLGWRAWVGGGRQSINGARATFRPTKTYRFVASEELAEWLMRKDDSGFVDGRETGPAKQRVARVLRTFGVLPARRRIHGDPLRGYEVGAIRAVWRKYRP